jgi:rod shape-determining protein MreD
MNKGSRFTSSSIMIAVFAYPLALLLSLLPYSQHWSSAFRPDFFVLLIAALSYFRPERLSFLMIVVFGILIDVLVVNAFIGQTALSLLVCSIICLSFEQKRLRLSHWQDALFVGILTLQNSLINELFTVASMGSLNYKLLIGPVFSNTIVWFLIITFL